MSRIFTFYELSEAERKKIADDSIQEQWSRFMDSPACKPFLRQFMAEFHERELKLGERGRSMLTHRLGIKKEPQFSEILDEIFLDLPKDDPRQNAAQQTSGPRVQPQGRQMNAQQAGAASAAQTSGPRVQPQGRQTNAQQAGAASAAQTSGPRVQPQGNPMNANQSASTSRPQAAASHQIPPTKLMQKAAIAAENGRRISAEGPTLLVVQKNGTVWADDIASVYLKRAVAKWRGIRCVTVGGGNAAALKYDGLILTHGKWNLNARWFGVTEIGAFGNDLNAVRADGSIISTQLFSSWSHASKTAVSYAQSGDGGIVLFHDGTVGCINTSGASNPYSASLKTWQNIIAVAAGPTHFVGLCKNGMVLAVGQNSYGQCNVGDWSDMIAIDACNGLTAGLTIDGRVYTTDKVLEKITASWQNIAAISVNIKEIIGVTNDGMLLSTARRRFEKCIPAVTPLR